LPRYRPLRFIEIAVARRHRQAVGLANDRRPEDLGRNVQIARQPPDDCQLLPVLFAKDRHIRLGLVQKLDHHLRHPVEMPRPRRAAKAIGQALDPHPGGEARPIHLVEAGGKDQVAAGALQHRRVAGLVAGIGGQILIRSELGRIDEDRRNHPLGMGPAKRDQAQMPLMQRAHGRRERDPLTRCAPGADPGAQIGNCADCFHREDPVVLWPNLNKWGA
jgi:hypothetical protein